MLLITLHPIKGNFGHVIVTSRGRSRVKSEKEISSEKNNFFLFFHQAKKKVAKDVEDNTQYSNTICIVRSYMGIWFPSSCTKWVCKK